MFVDNNHLEEDKSISTLGEQLQKTTQKMPLLGIALLPVLLRRQQVRG